MVETTSETETESDEQTEEETTGIPETEGNQNQWIIRAKESEWSELELVEETRLPNTEMKKHILGELDGDLYYLNGLDSVYVCRDFRSSNPKEELLYAGWGEIEAYVSVMIEDHIYLGLRTFKEKCQRAVLRIGTDGTVTTLYEIEDSIAGQYMAEAAGKVLIQRREEDGDYIDVLDLSTGSLETPLYFPYRENEMGVGTGNYVMCFGSMTDSGFYYELRVLNNENASLGEGVRELYFYDYAAKESRFLGNPFRTSWWLTGDEDYVFCTEYDYDVALDVLAKVYRLDDDGRLADRKVLNYLGKSWSGDLNVITRLSDGRYVGCSDVAMFVLDPETGQQTVYPVSNLAKGDKWSSLRIQVDPEGDIRLIMKEPNETRYYVFRLGLK
ncbi:MAG: hypothetical protein IJZ85_03460 [Lachnospiraceae bacterium]|nr:hypothetical protein [Lachnospiraceae bacterium]